MRTVGPGATKRVNWADPLEPSLKWKRQALASSAPKYKQRPVYEGKVG